MVFKEKGSRVGTYTYGTPELVKHNVEENPSWSILFYLFQI